MRVLSYNVRSLRDDREAVTSVIRACRPDVVCVQEAPRFLRWRSKAARLAEDSGLLVVTGGRSAAAMLLMAAMRVRVVDTSNVLLSKTRGLHQRGLAIAVVELAGDRFTVASMHLGLRDDERPRHLAEIRTVLAAYDAPLVLAGDVNETPDGPVWGQLAGWLQDAGAAADAPTYSATRPHKRIDGVFADPRLEVVSCEVPDLPAVRAASDHLPVLVELRPR